MTNAELLKTAREAMEALYRQLDSVIYREDALSEWAKIVTGIDPRKLNGHCVMGDFINRGLALVPQGAVVLERNEYGLNVIFRAVDNERKARVGASKDWYETQKILRNALYAEDWMPSEEPADTQEGHQMAAFAKLSRLNFGALFMRMGSGKTKVALDLCAHRAADVDVILWICPHSILPDFEAERAKWRPELSVRAYGIESISQSDSTYMEILRLLDGKRAVCVIDESLTIKNTGAKRTQRMVEIGKHCQYRYILNGTPISKGARDLFTQINFLSPKILSMTWGEFCKNYIIFDSSREEGHRYIKGYRHLDHLAELVTPYSYECDLEIDVAAKYKTIYYGNDFSSEYGKIKAEILSRMAYSDVDFYEMCTRLQRCYTRSGGKLDAVERAIAAHPGGKSLVFVKYLDSIPEGAPHITGTGSLAQRQKIREDFKRGDAPALWLTYGVGAKGINLQFADHVIFAEQTFDFAQKIHAEHRVLRTGQQSSAVYFTNIVCVCGMENIFVRNISKKGTLLGEINRNLKDKEALRQWVSGI
ncbi:MAG: DEAD/DEAH box helicase [Oscillospiraceae bacterium]|jgi:hypothetical protein|nr:DEAD/DEAH box helicase [Oscillospiraceae bacterium]